MFHIPRVYTYIQIVHARQFAYITNPRREAIVMQP